MPSRIKLLETYKTIWTEIDDLKTIELNALPVRADRYIKTKIRTYDTFYTNFRGLNVPEDRLEYDSFAIISIDFSLVYENKFYLQVSWKNCTYKILNAQMIEHLHDNLFESHKN